MVDFSPELLCAVGYAVGTYCPLHIEREPYRTSAMSGSMYVVELLKGRAERMIEVLGISQSSFLALRRFLVNVGALENSQYIAVDEQLAIFLWIVRGGQSFRQAGERFQRSLCTVQR